MEVNFAQTEDDEPSLLLAKHEDRTENKVLLTEKGVTPKLMPINQEKQGESNLWYLDNGASNHMTGDISKFNILEKGLTGRGKFGDGSTVKI